MVPFNDNISYRLHFNAAAAAPADSFRLRTAKIHPDLSNGVLFNFVENVFVPDEFQAPFADGNSNANGKLRRMETQREPS